MILKGTAVLDRQRVAVFLAEKAAARDVPVSRSAFHDPEVARLAAIGYDALAGTTRRTFVPFAEAMALLLGFVAELPIPE